SSVTPWVPYACAPGGPGSIPFHIRYTVAGYVPPPPGSYNQIQFVIGTGDDDLRGDSTATATLLAPNGKTLQVIPLKVQDEPAWNNNTIHTVTAALYPERPAASIGHIVISLNSHNSFAESDDNWNVQSVSAALLNNGRRMPLMSASGAPLDRLTSSHPRLTLP